MSKESVAQAQEIERMTGIITPDNPKFWEGKEAVGPINKILHDRTLENSKEKE